ncbi:MAG: DUF433 domain-containing protein [Bacteroidetes bacterium]|nr:DUF433 domain-containing protein [Bacteroidota bacterium]MCL5739141.1 DUF433 domain-containing protein [Bacteroidota bacterium]
MKELNDRVVIDPAIRFGKPVIKGTRVPVEVVLGRLAAGLTYKEVMKEYEITREDILAVLQYAVQYLSHEEISLVS